MKNYLLFLSLLTISLVSCVEDPVLNDLVVNKTSIELEVGEDVQLSVVQIPELGKLVSYSSNNESVATVTSDGKVDGIGVGTAIVTISSGNINKTCLVKVNPKTDFKFESMRYGLAEITNNTQVVYINISDSGVVGKHGDGFKLILSITIPLNTTSIVGTYEFSDITINDEVTPYKIVSGFTRNYSGTDINLGSWLLVTANNDPYYLDLTDNKIGEYYYAKCLPGAVIKIESDGDKYYKVTGNIKLQLDEFSEPSLYSIKFEGNIK